VRDRLSPARAEPRQQGFEALAILVSDGDESQAEPAVASYMTNYGVGFDAAFLNQEIELSGHAFFYA
jgi:hypothetical protein